MTELESEIIKLEESLFSDEVRASKLRLEQLIADEFIEVASSGIRFGKKEVLERLPTQGGIILCWIIDQTIFPL